MKVANSCSDWLYQCYDMRLTLISELILLNPLWPSWWVQDILCNCDVSVFNSYSSDEGVCKLVIRVCKAEHTTPANEEVDEVHRWQVHIRVCILVQEHADDKKLRNYRLDSILVSIKGSTGTQLWNLRESR